jgi:CheY-like chemotaxis protein
MIEPKYDLQITPETHSFFEYKKVLVLDPNKNLRSTLKKIFFDFGVGLSNIEFFEGTFDEAVERMHEEQPEIVVSPLSFGEQSALEFFELHNQILPDRMTSAFFIISSNNSLSTASIALDHDIDGYVSEPFTKVGIGSIILNSLGPKISNSPFEREKEKVKTLVKQKNYAEAQEQAEQLFSMKDAKLEEVFYLLGLCALQQRNFKEALEYLDQALQTKPGHY